MTSGTSAFLHEIRRHHRYLIMSSKSNNVWHRVRLMLNLYCSWLFMFFMIALAFDLEVSHCACIITTTNSCIDLYCWSVSFRVTMARVHWKTQKSGVYRGCHFWIIHRTNASGSLTLLSVHIDSQILRSRWDIFICF